MFISNVAVPEKWMEGQNELAFARVSVWRNRHWRHKGRGPRLSYGT